MKLKMGSAVFFILVLVLSSTLPSGSNSSNHLDGGWLEVKDGVRILHLNGSNYQMGYQRGYLLKEEYLKCRRALIYLLETQYNTSFDRLLYFWSKLNESIPQEYKEEMQGVADAVGLSFEEVAAMEAGDPAVACVLMAAWGPATLDGRLYSLRSSDWIIDFIDPVTKEYADDQLIIVRKPDDGFASVVIGSLLDVGWAEGGVNDQGITVGYTWVYSEYQNVYGIPLGIRQRMVLDHAQNVNEGAEILTSNRTSGVTFIVSDGKTNEAYVFEQNANYSHYGTWDDSIESNYPSSVIDHVVRRGGLYLDPVSAGLKEDAYKKSTLIRWVLSRFGLVKDFNFFFIIVHYKLFSKLIEKQWGKLDLDGTMEMLRSVYRGKTSLFCSLVEKLGGPFSQVRHQWVICPENGDILVSFSKYKKSAYKNAVHYFNMYDLMNATP